MTARDTEIRVSNLHAHDESAVEDFARTTPAERLQMMWQLTLDAWAFKGEPVIDQRLPRHVVRVRRLNSSGSE